MPTRRSRGKQQRISEGVVQGMAVIDEDYVTAHALNDYIAFRTGFCNDGADLLNDCKWMGLLARDRKITNDTFEPHSLLASVTSTPARALGMSGQLGVLQAKSLADVVFLRDDISMRPAFDDVRNLIYSAGSSGVEHVMIDGQWRLWRRELCSADEPQMTLAFDQAVQEIMRRTGLKP